MQSFFDYWKYTFYFLLKQPLLTTLYSKTIRLSINLNSYFNNFINFLFKTLCRRQHLAYYLISFNTISLFQVLDGKYCLKNGGVCLCTIFTNVYWWMRDQQRGVWKFFVSNLFKFINLHLKILQPHMVLSAKFNGRTVPESTYESVTFFFIYIITLHISFTPFIWWTWFFNVYINFCLAISNVGPGLGEIIGPEATMYSPTIQWCLSLLCLWED